MDFDEGIAFFARLGDRYQATEPAYGFVGRDIDILQIEKRLLRPATSAGNAGKRRNLLLIQDMGGTGKSTLLHHLARWWQTTGLVGEVFYFGYDLKAYHLQELLYTIAHRLLNRNIPAGATVSRDFATFQAMQLPVQARLLAQKLRSERHLLILDNLESVTGDPLAIPNTLPPTEQAALRTFLADLLDGATLVLLGSRGRAPWLRPGWRRAEADQPAPEPVEGRGWSALASASPSTGSGRSSAAAPLRDSDIYPLPGLDAGAAADLAERILTRQVATEAKRRAYAADPTFTRLIKLLDGSPLALEVVLSNLARQTPEAILAALEAGDTALDERRPAEAELVEARAIAERRTESIIACIAYSHSNLSPDAQQLLLCLAPFTGVINRPWLPQYTAQLQQQPALAHLPFTRWDAVLDEAINWGLLTPDGELAGYLRVQPIFPYFLRTRLQEEAALLQSIESAFCRHYDGVGQALHQAITSNKPEERRIGLALTQIEYENLSTALRLALRDQREFFNQYEALFRYFYTQNGHAQAAQLSEIVLAAQPAYEPSNLTDDIVLHFYLTYARAATSYLQLKEYTKAETAYSASLDYIAKLPGVSDKTKANYSAGTYHGLGMVAAEQRQWAQAEQHYQQALAIYIEFNDRYEQAGIYHQLGMVSEERRAWAQAEQHYQQALALKIEFNNRYGQGSTYHQLGRVAQERRAWAQAEQHYQQALALFIEFNDRYSQGSTYHQLGRLAEEQEQWAEARDYLLKDLEISTEFHDEHGVGITLRSLARLHRAGGDVTLPGAVAAVLGVDEATVLARFAAALGEGAAG